MVQNFEELLKIIHVYVPLTPIEVKEVVEKSEDDMINIILSSINIKPITFIFRDFHKRSRNIHFSYNNREEEQLIYDIYLEGKRFKFDVHYKDMFFSLITENSSFKNFSLKQFYFKFSYPSILYHGLQVHYFPYKLEIYDYGLSVSNTLKEKIRICRIKEQPDEDEQLYLLRQILLSRKYFNTWRNYRRKIRIKDIIFSFS